jgi:hypothetical protein
MTSIVARALNIIAETSRMRGDLETALASDLREQAELAALMAAHPRDPNNRGRRQRSADAALGQGLVHQARGNAAGALQAFNDSSAVYDALLKEQPEDDELALGAAHAQDADAIHRTPRGDS